MVSLLLALPLATLAVLWLPAYVVLVVMAANALCNGYRRVCSTSQCAWQAALGAAGLVSQRSLLEALARISELEAAHAHSDARHASLTSQLASGQTKLKQERAKRAAMTRDLAASHASLSQAQQLNAQLTHDNTQLQAENAQLRADLAASDTCLAQAQQHAAEERAAAADKLAHVQRQRDEEQADLVSAMMDLAGTKACLHQQQEEHNARVASLSSELHKAWATCAGMQATLAQAEYTSCKQRAELTAAAQASLRAKLVQAQAVFKQASAGASAPSTPTQRLSEATAAVCSDGDVDSGRLSQSSGSASGWPGGEEVSSCATSADSWANWPMQQVQGGLGGSS